MKLGLMKKLFGLVIIVIALSVMYGAVSDFNHARTWLNLFKALLWIIVSTACFELGKEKLS